MITEAEHGAPQRTQVLEIPSANDDTQSTVDNTSIRIRYRLELRDERTDRLVDQKVGNSPEKVHAALDADDQAVPPIFDVVETVKVVQVDEKDTNETKRRYRIKTSSTSSLWSLRIYSTAIINALQSVVKYYPSQNLVGNDITVRWPYPVLCHHYEDLTEFVNICKQKSPKDVCERERDAPIHVGRLLEWLDNDIMKEVRAEQERNRRNAFTWKWRWVSLRPGSTVVSIAGGAKRAGLLEAYVVQSVEGGSFVSEPEPWHQEVWHLSFDGNYIRRTREQWKSEVFDGERSFTDNRRVLTKAELGEEDDANLDDELKRLIRRGRKYWEATGKQCWWYSGRSAESPFNQIDALVMVDLQAYFAEKSRLPDCLDSEGLRNWSTDCRCPVCRFKGKSNEKPLFSDYRNFGPKSKSTWHQKLLCPPTVRAFVFRTRSWELLDVSLLEPAKFDTDMINNLVMDTTQLARLRALAKWYGRTDCTGSKMEQQAWSADFVQGKGQGLIFLLHGSPGVGKTCTAECIAEYLQRPLMVLTSSDIGTDPKEVEDNLTRDFKKAKSWGAVLLIDEADVFMEQRSTRDLNRNSLVAGFLRALEFYDGILFLTTNRVGTFDDAFISRIHVKLYYPDFTKGQRQQIWEMFVRKLQKDRGNHMRVTPDAKYYISSSQIRGIAWNGREIRNAFQTAVALAEYEAQKDDEGRIMLTDDHLKAVVEMSSAFKRYLKALHKKDESGRAALRQERLDNWIQMPDS